jgi:rRNA-processing protein FCF1
MSNNDIFINNKIFPDAADIFATSVQSISKVKDNCLFVLDTNALLLPYTTSSKSIDELKKVYTKLIKDKRLYIPGQVAREFAKNRPEKIKELFQQLNRKRDKVKNLYGGQYPLLTGIKEYTEAIEQEQKIDELLKEYSKKIGSVIEQIKNWTWNDPVSQVYNKLFTKDAIIDPAFDEEQTKKELQNRYLHKIPPGYKDESKPDEGIGDLLIWLTIIELAKTQKKNVVFVSGEEKTDWFYKSEGQALYPRFELTAEFREKANKKSFHIIKLSELLEIFGADDTVVKEVEIEERTIRRISHSDFLRQRQLIEYAVYNWVNDTYGKEWKIEFNEIGFPDIVLTKSDETKMGAEVVYFNRPDMVLMRFNEIFARAYFESNEKGYSKFIFFIVYPDTTLMETVFRKLDRIKEKYSTAKMTFEIIVGFINEKNKFEKL